MKKYITVYYLLLVLLIMGAFAAMAQNNYGLTLLGSVALVFALVFFVQWINCLRTPGNYRAYRMVEYAALTGLSVLFGLKIFQVYLPHVEWLPLICGGLLGFVYTKQALHEYRDYAGTNAALSRWILVYYSSLLLFILSLVIFTFKENIAGITGLTALLFLIIFVIAGFTKTKYVASGNAYTLFSLVFRFPNHSVLLLAIFALISVYLGLTGAGILPKIYSDEYPQAYYKLLNDAGAGSKQAGSQDKYEQFKSAYAKYLAHQSKTQ